MCVICKGGGKLAGKQAKQLRVSSPTLFPADQRPIFCTHLPGSSWETSSGGKRSKKALLQRKPSSYLISNQKALICIVSDALAPNREMNKGDQSECRDLIKHHRPSRRQFIKSGFRRDTTLGLAANCITN